MPAASVTALIRPRADIRHLADLGVQVVVGDYDDAGSLERALAGIDRLIFVSSPVLDPTVRSHQHRNVVDQAVDAGLDPVVYTSALGAEHDPGHLLTEQALAALPHTVLRNGLYTEPFVRRALVEASNQGVIRSSTEGCAVRTASWDDLAAAAVLAAVGGGLPSTMLSLNGPSWTYDELAQILTAHLGRTVTHQNVPDEELGAFGQVHALFRHGLLAHGPDELGRLLGREPRSIASVVEGGLPA